MTLEMLFQSQQQNPSGGHPNGPARQLGDTGPKHALPEVLGDVEPSQASMLPDPTEGHHTARSEHGETSRKSEAHDILEKGDGNEKGTHCDDGSPVAQERALPDQLEGPVVEVQEQPPHASVAPETEQHAENAQGEAGKVEARLDHLLVHGHSLHFEHTTAVGRAT